MHRLRKALAALVVAAVIAPSVPAHAQSVNARRRALITRPVAAPSGAVRVRSVPVATDRYRRPGDPGRFGHQRFKPGRARGFVRQAIYVPWGPTTVVGTGYDGAVLEALDEVREAVLDAREAALDAREAALEARDAVTGGSAFLTPPAGNTTAPSGGKVLTWKPGGITPVDPQPSRADRGRTIMLDEGPAKGAAPSRFPAARARLELPPVDLYPPANPWRLTEVATCEPLWLLRQRQRRQDRRRFPWGLGWLYRYGRDVEVERGTVAPPSFYMRSPLLSGLYRKPDCPPEGAAETCAEVTLVGDDDAAIAFDVPLPQLEAKTPEALRDAIRSGLAEGETMVLRTTDGEAFDLMPGTVREIGAGVCRLD